MRVLCVALCAAGLSVVPALAEPGKAVPEQKSMVSLSFHTTPPKVRAKVTWGRKVLGEAPFVLKWPRDSGPLDVVVSAQGYLPVHTRVYTFGDDKLYVKLTAVADKKTLFGYKREIPPPPPVPDGGTSPVSTPDGGIAPQVPQQIQAP